MDADSTLIERSVRGRPDAFVEVVQRHETAVYAFLARRAGDAVAADLLGEVWVRAFGGRSGYNLSYPNARPWLYGIARNVLRAHWRAADPPVPISRAEPAPRADPVSDPWDLVIDRLDANAAAPALAAALRTLPPAERDVLLLVAWEDLSPTQAAIVLGVPAGTARSRLHRARTALRQALAASHTEEES